MTEYRARAMSDSEVSRLYWETDTPTPQIISRFGLANAHALVKAAGAGRVEGLICKRCSEAVTVPSRSGLKELSARRSTPDVCVSCSKKEREDAFAEHKRHLQEFNDRLRELASMPYRDYLATPEWDKTRRAALRRAGFQCQTCSAGGRLNVHHRTYERRGNEYPRDLTVLCEDCHSLFHQNRQLAPKPSPRKRKAA